MKHSKTIAFASAVSLAVVFGGPASAVTVDDPIFDVVGNAAVRLEETTGHADGRINPE
ncbi:MAG: hypothetical protein AB1679_16200 [Actinomycetota bacterium]|jgi:hypothetical protein